MNVRILGLQLGLIKTAGAAWRAVRKGLISAADYASHMKVPVADVEAHLAQQKNFTENFSKINQTNSFVKEPLEWTERWVNKAFGKPYQIKKDWITDHGPLSNESNPLFARVKQRVEDTKDYQSLPMGWDRTFDKFISAQKGVQSSPSSVLTGTPPNAVLNKNTQLPAPKLKWQTNIDAVENYRFDELRKPISIDEFRKTMQPLHEKSWGKADIDLLFGIKPHHTEIYPNFSYDMRNGNLILPDIRAINRSPLKQTNFQLWKDTLNTALGIVKHEFGHPQTIHAFKPYAAQANLMERTLAHTRPINGWGFDHTNAAELLGHFRATQGNSFAAQAAIRLPLEKMQQVAPEVLAKWQQGFSHYPPSLYRLRDRFLAARAHAYINYSVR